MTALLFIPFGNGLPAGLTFGPIADGQFLRRIGALVEGDAKANFAAVTAPGVNDDSTQGYSVGSVWIDTTHLLAYVCLDATAGAAVWSEALLDNLSAVVDPGVNDDSTLGYAIGSTWFNLATRRVWRAFDVSAGAAVWEEMVNDNDARLSALYIPDPSATSFNANVTATNIVDPFTRFAPTATRKLDLRNAVRSFAFNACKVNAAAFGLTIDVTTGGNTGWTTPAGLNTDFPLPNSALAQTGQWAVVVDVPNKVIYVYPPS
jgi:hypothetical protein